MLLVPPELLLPCQVQCSAVEEPNQETGGGTADSDMEKCDLFFNTFVFTTLYFFKKNWCCTGGLIIEVILCLVNTGLLALKKCLKVILMNVIL